MLLETKCNLCGADSFFVLFRESDIYLPVDYKITMHEQGRSLRLVKCRRCGLIYANPRPQVNAILASYAEMVDEDYLKEESGRRLSARYTLKFLKKSAKKGKILEIGCAAGFLLDEAKNDGWEEVYGVELSKWAVAYARDVLKLENIFEGALKKARYPSSYFDAVVLKDTIEHLFSPKDILVEVRRILKPNGVLCVNTPDVGSLLSKMLKARWWGLKDAHLYYFTKQTLSEMFESCGFVTIKSRSSARSFTLGYWLGKAKHYNSRLFGYISWLVNLFNLKNKIFCFNLGDQVEMFARKSRKLKYLEELEAEAEQQEHTKKKVIVVLPAYNAGKTIKKTVADIPKESVDEIILVDDVSKDNTVEIAKKLGLKVFVHKKNSGYGANQKTCYTKALEEGADIVVMVHPDYQYDPKVIPLLIEPIQNGRADAVFGSRMMKGGALEGGMPPWKHNANIILTAFENVMLGTYLTEYHSGFRAYSAKYLRSVNFVLNSDGFIFDTEIIIQGLLKYMRIEEVPIRTRYFDEASSIKFWPSVIYGLGILKMLLKYVLHKGEITRFKQLE